MQRKHHLLKVTAVLSSVSLMAAFIAYRAGALDSLIPGRSNAGQREMMSSSKLRTLFVPNGPAALPGSKSDVVAAPSPVLVTEIPPEEPFVAPRVLISTGTTTATATRATTRTSRP